MQMHQFHRNITPSHASLCILQCQEQNGCEGKVMSTYLSIDSMQLRV
jgi:hypothetical protein